MTGFRILLAGILLVGCGHVVMAEEVKASSPDAAATVPAPAASQQTPLSIFDQSTEEMMKGLDENQTRQFVAISNSYGVIRSVEDVQQSIARAVESCGKENPDIRQSMSDRFEQWKEAVRPVTQKARSKLDKMILLQGFTQPSLVRAYLKKFDAAVVFRNQGIESIPVTQKDDCLKLQDSMAETQNNLVNLMTESLALNADLKVKE